eukprot:11778279-Alexandrium_andersonii.AAC.1
MREQRRRTHPSSFADEFEAALGPAQFQLRTPEASYRFTHGGLRVEAGWSPDEPWADCGLHFGHRAM